MHPQRFDGMPALGDEFRSAREARGLTLSDVAEQIHIRSVYLNAIESDDWSAIGAPVYVRGFLRTYARFLGLDAEAAVARFNETAPPERAVAPGAPPDEHEGSRLSLWAILGTLVAVLLVALVGYEDWQYSHARAGSATTSTAAVSQPAATADGSGPTVVPSAIPSATPSETPAPAARHRLAIRLTERSWLRVTVDGATKLEGIFPSGTSRTFTGNVADVRVGNAGGVLVTAGGRSPALMGKEGAVVEHRFLL